MVSSWPTKKKVNMSEEITPYIINNKIREFNFKRWELFSNEELKAIEKGLKLLCSENNKTLPKLINEDVRLKLQGENFINKEAIQDLKDEYDTIEHLEKELRKRKLKIYND